MSSHSNKTLIEEFKLLDLDNLSDRSRSEYLYILLQFQSFQKQRNKVLKDSNTLDLAAFLNEQKKSCTGSTRRRKFYALKKFYYFLKRKKLIDPEELEYFEKKAPKATKGDEAHRALTEEEIKQCQSMISHPLFRFIFFLGIEFGLRRNEYTRIKLEDLDLQRKRLRIHGKGDKVRFIPIAKRHLPRFEQFLKQRKLDEVKHVFLLYSKTGKTTNKTIDRYFQEMRKMSGVEFVSHDLRVTFATRYYKAGMDILVISKKLGHAKIQTTMTYVKPTEKEINDRFLAIVEEMPI